ncbi:MAG: hypothetical protein M9892_04685 [Bacteroidetes bacterium]|nr:hypothetical protein [Bacteroidota bacterium]
MARSVKYFYDIIIQEKDSLATLNEWQPQADTANNLLTDVSQSKVARWRIFSWCVACCAYALDVLFDLFKKELGVMVQNSRYGTLPWWEVTAKAYQHGHNLVWQNNQYEYVTDAPDSRFVNFAKAVESGRSVILKIAGGSEDSRQPVSGAVESGFMSYVKRVKPPGSHVVVVNAEADRLKLYLKIKYNPLVLSANGQLLENPSQKPVETAIATYLLNLPFNSKLEISKLSYELKQIEGVEAVYLIEAEGARHEGDFEAFAETYEPYSGYMVIDDEFPLSDTLTYEPF